jgi:4-hydroxythreonine-4-phosphate dehydrogenase
MEKPIIGLMLGDVTGIGPEVAVKLLKRPETRAQARVVVVGDLRVLRLGMEDARETLNVKTVASLRDIDWNDSEIPVIDLANTNPADFTRGVLSPESGVLDGFSPMN